MTAEPSPDAPPAAPKEAGLRQIAGAVFWSFFGVRKGRHMAADMGSIKPLHVILVGLGFAAMFVLALIALVRVIVGHAG